MLDSDGRPQPMPGMTYEDFLAAWKKLNQPKAADDQPGFTIQSIRFDGTAQDQRAELKFEATILILAEGSVEVPLGLVGGILQDKPQFGHGAPTGEQPAADNAAAGSSDDYLAYDPEHGGYIAHISGRAGELRTVSFGLIVPLLRDGSEITLPINCPRTLSSQLNLTINTPIAEARAANGAILSQELVNNSQTIVKVAGATGLFRLTWQSAGRDSPTATSVLNALGSVRVSIDGRGVRSDARLTVRSYGGTFDQFRVRLPAGRN